MSICFFGSPSLCFFTVIVVIQFVILQSWLNKLIDWMNWLTSILSPTVHDYVVHGCGGLSNEEESGGGSTRTEGKTCSISYSHTGTLLSFDLNSTNLSTRMFRYEYELENMTIAMQLNWGRPQWLKCKIRGVGTLHLGLGPWQWPCAFP